MSKNLDISDLKKVSETLLIVNSNPDKIDITYQWGIDHLQEIETWDKRIKLVEEWSCLDRHRNRLQWMGLLGFLPLLKRQVKVGHVRLN